MFRRAERERRRQARIRNVITAALAVLTVAAVIGAGVSWRELKTNESFLDATLKTTSGLVRSAVEQSKAQGASVASTTSLLKQTERLFADMRKFGRKTPELDLREALMRIDQSTNFRLIGQTDLALAQAQQASSIVARLGGAYAAAYARALIAHGEVLYETNQKRPAFDLFTQARTVALNAAKADPGNDDVQRSLIAAELRICEYELVDHRYVDARAVAQSALDRAERLVTRNIPDDPDARSDWLTDVFVKSRASSFLAETYQLDDQAAQALEFYGKALVTRKQLVAYAADNTRFRSSLADVHDKIGELLGQDKDKLAEAAANLSESVKIRRDLSSADRSNQEWLTRLASTLTSLGDIREAEGQLEQALALYEEALAVAGGVADHEPGTTTGLRERASAQVGIAGIHDKQHRSKLALDEYAVARKVIERLAAAAPDDKAWKDALAQIDGEIDRIRVETSGAPKTADTK